MIFLTLGTHEPFDRLVRAVDDWCASRGRGRGDVFGQIVSPGATGYRPKHFEWVDRIPPDEYQSRFAQADFVIAHAGMGSIITAMSLARPIVLMPRRAALGEQRNDHQLATVERFRGKPGIFVAMTETELPQVLDTLSAAGDVAVASVSPFAEDRLIATLRQTILGT